MNSIIRPLSSLLWNNGNSNNYIDDFITTSPSPSTTATATSPSLPTSLALSSLNNNNNNGSTSVPAIFLLLSSSAVVFTATTATAAATTSTDSIPAEDNNQTFLDEECHKQYIDIDDVENYKDLNFPGEFKEFGLDEYFKITLYVLVILFSLFGNSAVVISVIMKRSLRVTVNLYLANLAVADILICVCCMWVHLVNHLTAPAFVLGPFLCKINSFAQMTCLTSSVLTLSAIACDRYMAIMYPLRTRVTKQRTSIVITSIWLISGFISIPFCLLRRYEKIEWRDYTQITCYEDWPYTIFYSPGQQGCDKKHSLKTFYYTLVATTLFFAPVLIMITAYSAIIWILWGSKLPGEANESNMRHQKKSKRKVIKMVVVVLLVFVICWLPLQIIVLYSVYFHSSNEMLPSWFGNLIFYSYFIAYSNSAVNPIIYGGFNKNFRDAIFRNKFCRSIWCLGGSPDGRPRWQQPQYSTGSMSTIVTTVQNRNGSSSHRTSILKKNLSQPPIPANLTSSSSLSTVTPQRSPQHRQLSQHVSLPLTSMVVKGSCERKSSLACLNKNRKHPVVTDDNCELMATTEMNSNINYNSINNENGLQNADDLFESESMSSYLKLN